MSNENFRNLMKEFPVLDHQFSTLKSMGYFDAPASTKYHLNYSGGLLEHSVNVARTLIKLTEANVLQWQREESPVIIGLFHDLCKSDQYTYVNDHFEYSNNPLLKGHGDKSIVMLSEIMRLTEEEIMCIRYHMGAFTDKEEWSLYTNAIHKYPNILWVHQADMIATHIIEVNKGE